MENRSLNVEIDIKINTKVLMECKDIQGETIQEKVDWIKSKVANIDFGHPEIIEVDDVEIIDNHKELVKNIFDIHLHTKEPFEEILDGSVDAKEEGVTVEILEEFAKKVEYPHTIETPFADVVYDSYESEGKIVGESQGCGDPDCPNCGGGSISNVLEGIFDEDEDEVLPDSRILEMAGLTIDDLEDTKKCIKALEEKCLWAVSPKSDQPFPIRAFAIFLEYGLERIEEKLDELDIDYDGFSVWSVDEDIMDKIPDIDDRPLFVEFYLEDDDGKAITNLNNAFVNLKALGTQGDLALNGQTPFIRAFATEAEAIEHTLDTWKDRCEGMSNHQYIDGEILLKMKLQAIKGSEK